MPPTTMTDRQSRPLRVALYARVSTAGQTTDNQILELRAHAERNAWTTTEYLDQGISGTRESRPALDRLMADARRRQFDAVVVWRLDRFGRSIRHIITALDELQACGVSFISLGEGIDLGTPAGRLQLHMLSALAQFERDRIRERIFAGLARARAQGRRLGRRPVVHPKSAEHAIVADLSLPSADVAKRLGVSRGTVNKIRRELRNRAEQQSPLAAGDRPDTIQAAS